MEIGGDVVAVVDTAAGADHGRPGERIGEAEARSEVIAVHAALAVR